LDSSQSINTLWESTKEILRTKTPYKKQVVEDHEDGKVAITCPSEAEPLTKQA
jgi:hypothetical protein